MAIAFALFMLAELVRRRRDHAAPARSLQRSQILDEIVHLPGLVSRAQAA